MFTFTEQEKENIKQAVAKVENETSGEIVPVFVEMSDTYPEVPWKSSALFAVSGVIMQGVLSYLWMIPEHMTPLHMTLIIAGLAVVGFVGPLYLKKTRIWLAGERNQKMRAFEKAERAFLEHGLYKTVDKTGVLIFISYLEKEVIVMGDEGINAKVSSEEWQHIVDTIINGIKTKKVAEGIVEAILQCEDLLLKNGFVIKPDDTNELPDDIRIGQ